MIIILFAFLIWFPFSNIFAKDSTSLEEITFIGEHSKDPNRAALKLTVIPEIQEALTSYLHEKGNPIAAVVLVEVKTGKVLAMVQGRSPKEWGSESHTALYSKFPAASIFKTVATAAALEVADLDPDQLIPLGSSCGKEVDSNPAWLDEAPKYYRNISLRTAFASSCNNFFAMLSVRYLGVGVIEEFAHKFGWGKTLAADFFVPTSPMSVPYVNESSVHNVGRYTAGFGMVGMSVVHGAWLATTISNHGVPKTLQLFASSDETAKLDPNSLTTIRTQPEALAVFSSKSSNLMLDIMHKTVLSGTASTVFSSSKYRMLKYMAGGKTGTLTGSNPKGLTTWFTGIMPYDQPEVAVSAVVVIDEPMWRIKGSHLAAEALYQWNRYRNSNVAVKPFKYSAPAFVPSSIKTAAHGSTKKHKNIVKHKMHSSAKHSKRHVGGKNQAVSKSA